MSIQRLVERDNAMGPTSSDGLAEFKEDQSGSEAVPMISKALKWIRTIQQSHNTIVPRIIPTKAHLPTSTPFYLATVVACI
jgi:hypothetical protein